MKSISNWSVWYKNKGHKVEPEIPSINKMLEHQVAPNIFPHERVYLLQDQLQPPTRLGERARY